MQSRAQKNDWRGNSRAFAKQLSHNQWFWRRKCHMGHCPHVMQNQCDKFESYGTFSRIISSLTKFIGYMLQLYPKYLNRCKTNELWCNLHKKKRKNIIFPVIKTFFNIFGRIYRDILFGFFFTKKTIRNLCEPMALTYPVSVKWAGPFLPYGPSWASTS